MVANSKFTKLYESAFARYTQGNGFLAGDVVKFKKNTPKSEWFKSKPVATQKLILAMMATEGNLRIGILKNEFPYNIGAHGASDQPAAMADIYVELSPANWAYPMTVPLERLELVERKDNTIGGPVPENIKDRPRTQIKGKKRQRGGDSAKQTKVDDSHRELQMKNVSMPNGVKWDDSKVGGGNVQYMPGNKKLKESVDLEGVYDFMLREHTDPEGAKQLLESITEESEFDQCDFEQTDTGATVRFRDTVYDSSIGDEIPVLVTAELSKVEGSQYGIETGWNVDRVSAISEQTKRPINLTEKDLEYLNNRATDFANKQGKAATGVVGEAGRGIDRTFQVGNHNIRYTDRTVGKEDPTQMETWSFDNGFELIQFWGDYELKNAKGERIAFGNAKHIGPFLHKLGLPTLDELDAAVEQSRQDNADSDYYNRLMGDTSP